MACREAYGNGARCAVSFAKEPELIKNQWNFNDGMHKGLILEMTWYQ